MNTNQVASLLNEAIAYNEELFLIDFTISSAGDIVVVVDGDNGVPLEECMRISRHIEHNLDREENDFSLQVTTPDISKPITHIRQYKKNIGRSLKIQTAQEKIEGELVAVEDTQLVITWRAREPKPIGKGKHTVVKTAEIAIADIIKATVKIVYN